MKKLNETKRVGVVLLTMCLLWLVACKRDQLQPLTPSILNTYRGTDKMVLQVIETLKEPVNKALLAELEKQGSINWEYKALITSRFLEGITLRFATGGNGDYLDAEINAETNAIRLFSNQMQQQRDAMAQQAFKSQFSKLGKGVLSTNCTYLVIFEYEVESPNFELRVLADFLVRILLEKIREAELTVVNVEGWRITFTGGQTTIRTADYIRGVLMELVRIIGPEKFVLKTMDITGSCDDGPPLIQTIPSIIWEPQTFPVVNDYGDSETVWKALYPDCYVVYDGKDQSYKIKIISVHGRVETTIRTGGSRDPIVNPPQTESEATDAINSMKNYLTQKRGAWHMVEASKAHEAYHYSEYKAFAAYYWPLVGACINKIKVPSSGNKANDEALAANQLFQVLDVIDNISKAYGLFMNYALDVPGGRSYQVGQAILNQAIVQVQQLAASKGWRVPQGITPVAFNGSAPPFQPITYFSCPIF